MIKIAPLTRPIHSQRVVYPATLLVPDYDRQGERGCQSLDDSSTAAQAAVTLSEFWLDSGFASSGVRAGEAAQHASDVLQAADQEGTAAGPAFP
jgi:hypothetical protein